MAASRFGFENLFCYFSRYFRMTCYLKSDWKVSLKKNIFAKNELQIIQEKI